MDYVTVDEIAAEVRIAKETVRHWCRTGQLKSLRVGRQYRILRSDWLDFKQRMEVPEEPKKANGLAAFAN